MLKPGQQGQTQGETGKGVKERSRLNFRRAQTSANERLMQRIEKVYPLAARQPVARATTELFDTLLVSRSAWDAVNQSDQHFRHLCIAHGRPVATGQEIL